MTVAATSRGSADELDGPMNPEDIYDADTETLMEYLLKGGDSDEMRFLVEREVQERQHMENLRSEILNRFAGNPEVDESDPQDVSASARVTSALMDTPVAGRVPSRVARSSPRKATPREHSPAPSRPVEGPPLGEWKPTPVAGMAFVVGNPNGRRKPWKKVARRVGKVRKREADQSRPKLERIKEYAEKTRLQRKLAVEQRESRRLKKEPLEETEERECVHNPDEPCHQSGSTEGLPLRCEGDDEGLKDANATEDRDGTESIPSSSRYTSDEFDESSISHPSLASEEPNSETSIDRAQSSVGNEINDLFSERQDTPLSGSASPAPTTPVEESKHGGSETGDGGPPELAMGGEAVVDTKEGDYLSDTCVAADEGEDSVTEVDDAVHHQPTPEVDHDQALIGGEDTEPEAPEGRHLRSPPPSEALVEPPGSASKTSTRRVEQVFESAMTQDYSSMFGSFAETFTWGYEASKNQGGVNPADRSLLSLENCCWHVNLGPWRSEEVYPIARHFADFQAPRPGQQMT
ncbi:hypothetical protein FOZ60_016210 [Perkinsus olseni]|uniref:Uncharacterized protein n=1 Tax=Perkinsus olseni TaxID=32597 RepID=A0A7J6P5H8_PEROL|nr:hypothetical protein FOZ60_016210 [Perkinsus olseni]